MDARKCNTVQRIVLFRGYVGREPCRKRSLFLGCIRHKKSATLKRRQIATREEGSETSHVLEQEHFLKPLCACHEKMRPYQVLFI